ncbi:MAG TPA: hypothetical protein VFU64_08870 [Gaiellaceae bacterium]|nr:hypothetical protein [Gaiellaceae bacterium]
MSIVNRRNAVIGFLTLKAGKVIARRKAKRMGSQLKFWRKRSDNKQSDKSA